MFNYPLSQGNQLNNRQNYKYFINNHDLYNKLVRLDLFVCFKLFIF